MIIQPTINLAPLLATLGGIPPAVAGAISEVTFDLVDYHRKKVLTRTEKFPGRRGAQKYLAARLFRYGRKRPDPTEIQDVQGESFAVEGGTRSGAMRNLEEGADIDTSSYMIIPIESGLQERAWGHTKAGRFASLMKQGKIFIMYRKGKPPLLVSRPKRGDPKVYAVLLKHRHQRKLLQFYAAYDEVWAKKQAGFDRVLELALTEAGRSTLARENMAAKAGRDVFSAMRAEALRNGLSFGEAKKVAKAASSAARRAIRGGKAES